MAISFPTTPYTGQLFSVGNISWVWNGNSWDAAMAGSGQMNYAQAFNSQVTLSSSPSNIASVTIKTNGNPVLVSCNGDANPLTAGGWCTMKLYRDSTAIGQTVQTEGSSSNENSPYNLQVIDAPPAGTYTYYLKMITNSGNMQFGEAAGPTMYALELTGAVGPGVNNASTQTGITIGATTTSPTGGTRAIDKIETQVLGNKIRLTYRLAISGATAGSGDYLLSLPSGVAFNQTYNGWTTNNAWQPDLPTQVTYNIPAFGGLVYSANWNNQIMVVPYDSTRFRILTTNNNVNSYQYWSSSFYPTNTSGGLGLNMQFEIWKV